jgi:hypothetical protein
VFPVRYELDFYIPEDGNLHSFASMLFLLRLAPCPVLCGPAICFSASNDTKHKNLRIINTVAGENGMFGSDLGLRT